MYVNENGDPDLGGNLDKAFAEIRNASYTVVYREVSASSEEQQHTNPRQESPHHRTRARARTRTEKVDQKREEQARIRKSFCLFCVLLVLAIMHLIKSSRLIVKWDILCSIDY